MVFDNFTGTQEQKWTKKQKALVSPVQGLIYLFAPNKSYVSLSPISAVNTNFGGPPGLCNLTSEKIPTFAGGMTAVNVLPKKPAASDTGALKSAEPLKQARIRTETDPLTGMLIEAAAQESQNDVAIPAILRSPTFNAEALRPVDRTESDFQEALALFLSDIAVQPLPSPPPPVFPTLLDAVLLSRDGRWDKALAVAEKALQQRCSR